MSGLELKTGASIMAIGGFTGSDNSPTLAQFQAYVADHQVRYFIASDRGVARTARQVGPAATRSRHGCSRTSPRSDVGGTTVYDLPIPLIRRPVW